MVKRAGGALLLGIAIEHGAARPVSTQLYASLRDLMLSGSLAAGERLPATRTLARDLGVSRTTVIDAFERLTAEGLIDSRVGSGTFVSVALAADRPGRAPERSGPDVPHAPVLSRTMASAVERFGTRQRLPHTPGAFVTALPAFDAFPMATMGPHRREALAPRTERGNGVWRAERPSRVATGHRRTPSRQSRHKLRRGADLHRRWGPAGLLIDRHAPAESRRRGLVREPGSYRRSQ